MYGKAFIIVIAFAGLGMFCGPVMDLAASWSASIPGGIVAVATLTIAIGVVLFTSLEQSMTQTDAAYMSVIAGTSIGYVIVGWRLACERDGGFRLIPASLFYLAFLS